MLVGVFIMGKVYRTLDYVAMVSLTTGMVIFSVGDAFLTTEFPFKGVLNFIEVMVNLISRSVCFSERF